MTIRTTLTTAIALSLAILGTACDLYPWIDGQGETGGDSPENASQAWCFKNPQDPNQPLRDFCYPASDPSPGEFYELTDCAAVFDFDAWNYDGSCAPGNGCSPSPRTSRLCFDDGQADAVSGKGPGDLSVRTCWEDAGANGDTEPSQFLSLEYSDQAMLSPLCPPNNVSDQGLLCDWQQGVVCLSHNLFCACGCEDDTDCDGPSVCEGFSPGAEQPSFCVMPFG